MAPDVEMKEVEKVDKKEEVKVVEEVIEVKEEKEETKEERKARKRAAKEVSFPIGDELTTGQGCGNGSCEDRGEDGRG